MRLRRVGTGVLALAFGAAPAVALRSASAAARQLTSSRAAGPAANAAPAANATAAKTPAQRAKHGALWATVDLCNTAKHPNTIGIRGSMPGDGHRRDTMYMRFVVQNYDLSADSGFVLVGSAASTRQAGHSFTFKPTVTTFTLRGLVEFQWHRAGRTVRSLTLPTTAGHRSLAGDEPKGFSAASCALP
jgi:hypothetical protein